MKNKEDFIVELKKLMIKYNASIGFTCSSDSDTHGLYNEHIVIQIDNEPVIEAEGWWLNPWDF